MGMAKREVGNGKKSKGLQRDTVHGTFKDVGPFGGKSDLISILLSCFTFSVLYVVGGDFAR